ncbi:CMD domain protein [Roseococcus pinisoli]|uniref:CMD domain protein n=1 Tax=Roseococcus pinisoli TaxID=2835040 RepID=A0ABS5QBF8_9PROT|nr:CMD domain protein [Roseococcus pinisoli]MBS7811000.1 CMD domain protein [Roseococcus pinisoli]
MTVDVIDRLVGITPGSPLDGIRAQRPEARTHAQKSYEALFTPADAGGVTSAERFALAFYVVGLHGEAETAAFYGEGLPPGGLREAVESAVAQTRTHGPYGAFPAGPLSREDKAGPAYAVDAATTSALGPRLAAAFAHAHMLVYHPRDAGPDTLAAMLAAGWTTTDVVTLSQIVSFLSFQIRVVAGFRVLRRAS